MSLNCELHKNIMLEARSTRDKRNDLYFQVAGDVANFEYFHPGK